MPEFHAEFGQVTSQQNIPLWKVIEEKRSAWLDCADALRDPTLAPVEVIIVGSQVVIALTIFLA
jgi:hypothetical protein